MTFLYVLGKYPEVDIASSPFHGTPFQIEDNGQYYNSTNIGIFIITEIFSRNRCTTVESN